MAGRVFAGETPDLPDWVKQDHFDQVRRLNRQLAVLKDDERIDAYYRDSIAPTAYHRAGLVLPEDTDAAQIIFRRTRALLDELKTLSPKAPAGFEPAMAALKARLEAGAPLVVPFSAIEHRRTVSAGSRAVPLKKIELPTVSDMVPDITEGDGTLGLNLSALDDLLAPVKKKKKKAVPNVAEAKKEKPVPVTKEADAPKMDTLPPELRSVVVRTDGREPPLDLAHPRIVLAMDILALQRCIALANPLLGDHELLLCLRRPGQDHIAGQYKMTAGNEKSGLYRMSGHRDNAPVLTELLQGAKVASGRLAEQPIDGPSRTAAELKPGAFGWPDLRWDGKQIVFAWKEHDVCDHGRENTVDYYNGSGSSQYSRERCYHIFALDLHSGAADRLRMLTDGSGNDGHPVYLPNGRIVFVSDRRGGIERCGGPSRATLLHSMNPDGSDQVNLSAHETSEFSPGVNHDGRIVYGRWDYVDRGDCIAHHIWTSYPDGRDPRAPHGNYFMGKFRPDAETEFQPIPGDNRLIAIAAAHHILGHRGSLIVLDLDRADDDGMNQIRRFTPDIPFPETREPDLGQRAGPLACPWPLSRNFVLAGSDAGPVLLDAFGNRTLLAKFEARHPTFEVIPLRPRRRPPVIPHQVAVGAPGGNGKPSQQVPATGTFSLIDVYNSLLPWPEDTKISALRIVKIYPRANTIWMNWPDVGVATESLVRGVVGTVPVEADGSAYFEIPADTLVYFQALDAEGRAVQTMRSGTYLQPGAHVTCQGCHEPKHRAPPMPKKIPLALRRRPSIPDPGPPHSNPVFYPKLVQPVLDKNCVSCHAESIAQGKKAPDLSPTPLLKGGRDGSILHTAHGPPTRWTVSYENLSRYTGMNFGGRPVKYAGRTTPGSFGTINSKLYPMLADGKHHRVKLSNEEMRCLTVWMDLNSNFLGHYLFTDEQSRGILPVLPLTCYPDVSDNPDACIVIAERKEGSVPETLAETRTGASAAASAAPPKRKIPRLDDAQDGTDTDFLLE